MLNKIFKFNNKNFNSLSDVSKVNSRSLWGDAYYRLMQNKLAIMSLILLTIISLLVILGPYLSLYDYDAIDWQSMQTGPNAKSGHFFGTDLLGRDIFTRTLYGGRMSLMVGLVATLVSVIIGVSYGAISGFLGGKVDGFLMRIVDVLYTLPFMFFVILLYIGGS